MTDKNDTEATIGVLLSAGRTVPEVTKLLEVEKSTVREVAKHLNLCGDDEQMKRAHHLFTNEGLDYSAISADISTKKKPVHRLTVAAWARRYGWPWGGAEDGEYFQRPKSVGSRRWVIRQNAKARAETNSPKAIELAADAAWEHLISGQRVVALAVIDGCAEMEVTDVAAVRRALLKKHGDEIRSTTVDD